MASAAPEDFLTCAVCSEIFNDPVSLSCGHSFCYNCIKSHWEQDETRTCPVCRRRSSKTLWDLFNLKESSVSEKAHGEEEVVCFEHPDEKPMFCKDEGRAFCPVCEFDEHKDHTLETVEELREQFEEKLKCQEEESEEDTEEEALHEETKQHSEQMREGLRVPHRSSVPPATAVASRKGTGKGPVPGARGAAKTGQDQRTRAVGHGAVALPVPKITDARKKPAERR